MTEKTADESNEARADILFDYATETLTLAGVLAREQKDRNEWISSELSDEEKEMHPYLYVRDDAILQAAASIVAARSELPLIPNFVSEDDTD